MITTRLNAAMWVLIFTCACLSSFSVAHEGVTHDSPDGDRSVDGLHWLDSRQAATGEVAAESDIATAFQSTAEAAMAFSAFDYGDAELDSALAYLNSLEGPLNTEYLARLAILASATEQDPQSPVQELLQRQNKDGGFGHYDGFSSTPIDSAYVLIALAANDLNSAAVVSPALNYLISRQLADGGFSVSYETAPSVAVTSLVVIALRHHLFSYNVAPTLNEAIDYLYSAQNAGSGWASHWENSLALQALVPVTTETSRYESAVTSLTAAQGSEGDWDDSPYTTAMALAAIRLLSSVSVPADPSKGSITGKLTSAETGAAISGAAIDVAGSTVPAEIESNGSFVVPNLEPGDYQITYSAPGYLSAVQNITLRQGQLANVGTVRLSVSPTTALVSGQVQDAASGSPIAGAQVSIDLNGDVYTTATDTEGGYRQTVPAGSANLTVTSAEHYPASVQAELRAGSHTLFSPSLVSLDASEPVSSRVVGRIVDAETGDPIESASVITADTTASSDSDGRFEISDVEAGALNLQVVKSGYEGRAMGIVVPERAIADVGVIELQPQVEQDTTTVSGRITDLSSGAPVENASVSVGPAGGRTDANGFYRLEGINLLEFEVSVNATGYVFSKKLITLTEHTSVTADILLRRAEVGGVAVTGVETDKDAYNSFEPVQIAATLRNETAIEQRVRLYVNVRNADGERVTSFPAVELPELGINPSEEELAHFEGHLAESVEVLLPNQELSIPLQNWWNVGRVVPGAYELSVQALDAATSQLMSKLSAPATVAVTEDIASMRLSASPEFALLNSSADLEIRADVFNRSNVPVSTELRYRLFSPSGTLLTEGTTTLNLESDTTNESVVLETLEQSFLESGRYSLEAEILSGVSPGIINTGDVFVPPSTRIDVQQGLSPYEAVPLEGVKVQINIEVKGVDSEQ